MKLFLTILVSLCSSILFAQPIVNRAGNANTVADGRHQSTLNDFLPRYADTTTANLPANIGIDSCGAQIFTYDINSVWIRKCSPKRWEKVERNIYIADGTQIDALRQYDFNGGKLKFIDNGSMIIGDAAQQSVSAAKLQVVNHPRQPVVSFGNLPVDGIPIAMFQTDTVTAANLASQTGRWAQIHRNLYVNDNALSISDKSTITMALIVAARDSTRLNTNGGDLEFASKSSLALTKFPGHTSRTVIQGGTVNFDAVPANMGQVSTSGSTSSTNNIRGRGWFSGYTSYINVSNANDTIDNWIGFLSSGINASGGHILKYHAFYNGNVPADSNWTVYSPASNVRSYHAGPFGIGPGSTGPSEMLEVTGRVKMVDGNQGAGKVLTSDANGVGTWQTVSGGSQSWNAVMTVSPNLSSSYTSNLNNNAWNLQNTNDFTIHSDAGVTTRLKLNSSTSNLFAPNGSAGFHITNDTTFVKGTTQADLSSEGQAVVWNNTDYIQLYSGTAAGVSLGNGGFFELTQQSNVITSTTSNGTRVASYGGDAVADSTTQVSLLAQSESRSDQIIVGFDPNSTTKRGIHLFSGGDSVFIRYGWGPPSSSSLTGYALQARNTTTGSLVDFTGSISTTWNGITNPTGDQALTFDAGEGTVWTNSNTTEDLFTVNSSTVTTSSFFSLNRTSTALAAGNNIMELVSSGANVSSSITATGLSISVTNTGTSSTNTAARLVASGGTNNYALSTSGTTLVNDFDIAASGLSTTPAMALRSTTNDIEGALIIANNANYVSIAKITAMRMQFTQDLQLDVVGGDFHINSSQTSFGFGVDPTAKIHIGSSSTAAGSGQIKFAEGTALTTPEDGTLNYVSNNLQFTETSTVYILAKTLTNTATLDFGSTAAGSSTDLTVSLTGAAVGDAVVIGVDNTAMPDNGVFFGWVSATNTVSIRYANNDLTNAKDPVSATFRVSVLKY